MTLVFAPEYVWQPWLAALVAMLAGILGFATIGLSIFLVR